MKYHDHQNQCQGFTLTELITGIAIVGILSSAAIPNYLGQLERTKQNGMAATMEQILVRVVSFKEEIGIPPTTWKDLNNQSAIMTKSGPASDNDGDLNQSIELSGSDYILKRSNSSPNGDYYIFTATNSNNIEGNVIGCIDLNTGASDVKLGIVNTTDQSAAKESDLICQ